MIPPKIQNMLDEMEEASTKLRSEILKPLEDFLETNKFRFITAGSENYRYANLNMIMQLLTDLIGMHYAMLVAHCIRNELPCPPPKFVLDELHRTLKTGLELAQAQTSEPKTQH